MNLRVTAKWVALALAGLAIAVGVAIAAANLASQQIGIASESVSAGDTLAPSLRAPEKEGKRGGHDRGPSDETTTPTESTTPGEETPPEETPPPGEFTEPGQRSDDYGGGGGGDD